MYTMWRYAGSMRSHSKPQHQSDNGNFDDSLQFGRCETCKARSVLTDVEKTKAAIKSGFAGFVEANGRKPHYASCRIVWKYTNDSEDVKIRLLESGESIGNDMFFSCNSLHALESLAEFGKNRSS